VTIRTRPVIGHTVEFKTPGERKRTPYKSDALWQIRAGRSLQVGVVIALVGTRLTVARYNYSTGEWYQDEQWHLNMPVDELAVRYMEAHP
jgi:hypothetical protein